MTVIFHYTINYRLSSRRVYDSIVLHWFRRREQRQLMRLEVN